MTKSVALHNLGCKVNAYETESMQQMLEQAGYEIVPFAPGADIYIINTCTVTNIADRKSRQMLHKAKKMNPEAVVVAAGCYVESEKYAGGKVDDAIDIVIGNNCKKDLVEILRDAMIGTWTYYSEINVLRYVGQGGVMKHDGTIDINLNTYRSYVLPDDRCIFDEWFNKNRKGEIGETVNFRIRFDDKIYYIQSFLLNYFTVDKISWIWKK